MWQTAWQTDGAIRRAMIDRTTLAAPLLTLRRGRRWVWGLYGLRNYRKKLNETLKQDVNDAKKAQQCN